MDNLLINMTLATCDGWIMDNLPIIMTLASPRPLLGMQGALGEGWEGIFVTLGRQYCTIKAPTMWQNMGQVFSSYLHQLPTKMGGII